VLGVSERIVDALEAAAAGRVSPPA
jgi:hypothetical protein